MRLKKHITYSILYMKKFANPDSLKAGRLIPNRASWFYHRTNSGHHRANLCYHRENLCYQKTNLCYHRASLCYHRANLCYHRANLCYQWKFPLPQFGEKTRQGSFHPMTLNLFEFLFCIHFNFRLLSWANYGYN